MYRGGAIVESKWNLGEVYEPESELEAEQGLQGESCPSSLAVEWSDAAPAALRKLRLHACKRSAIDGESTCLGLSNGPLGPYVKPQREASAGAEAAQNW